MTSLNIQKQKSSARSVNRLKCLHVSQQLPANAGQLTQNAISVDLHLSSIQKKVTWILSVTTLLYSSSATLNFSRALTTWLNVTLKQTCTMHRATGTSGLPCLRPFTR